MWHSPVLIFLFFFFFFSLQWRQRSHKEDSVWVCGGQSKGGSGLRWGPIQPTLSGKLQSGAHTVEPGRVSTAMGNTLAETGLMGFANAWAEVTGHAFRQRHIQVQLVRMWRFKSNFDVSLFLIFLLFSYLWLCIFTPPKKSTITNCTVTCQLKQLYFEISSGSTTFLCFMSTSKTSRLFLAQMEGQSEEMSPRKIVLCCAVYGLSNHSNRVKRKAVFSEFQRLSLIKMTSVELSQNNAVKSGFQPQL